MLLFLCLFQLQFSPRPISKSNFFFNRRKNAFRIAQAKLSLSPHYASFMKRTQPVYSQVPVVYGQGQKKTNEKSELGMDAKNNTNVINQ